MIQITDIEQAYSVYKRIPEFSRKIELEEMISRVGSKFLSLVYKHDGQSVAFKLGYEISNTEFYSWLGGVESQYRGLGIAKQLMFKQEEWAHDNGYNIIRVKSMNRYPSMMCMLISKGYYIDQLSESDSVHNLKIHFYKNI